MIFIYTDGASRGNPGKSASGYRIIDDKGTLLFSHSFYNGIRTNNEAEYLAVIAALERAEKELGSRISVLLRSDSQIVVMQMKGLYKTKKKELLELREKAATAASKFSSFSIENVPREDTEITKVDKSLNRLLDLQSSHEKGVIPPA